MKTNQELKRIPITRNRQLKQLENNEVVLGYMDGRNNDPKPNDNRTYSYWHGWRNGMVDGGHTEKDTSQILLAKDYLQ